MLLGMPLSEVAWLVLLIVCGGALVGLLSGVFGIGGGAVIVPVLFEVFRVLGVPDDLRFQACIGTSLAIIVPTTIRSYLAHKARGAVLEDVVRIWRVPSLIGVAVGALAAAFAPSAVFKITFAIFAAFIAIRMLAGGDRWSLGQDLPGRGVLNFFGFLTGLVSSLVGVSGGAISNAVITLYGRPMQQAVATSAGVGVPITIAGTVGYIIAGWPHMGELPPLSVGYVSLIGVALMAPVSSYTASFGVRLAHWMPRRTLEIAFGLFLAVVSLRFLVTLF
ncbi:MAG: sulfite exporter TauE/SafE family protein [Xanthobacteraceae bacterium]|uniref:sulfite exporter TauE/SafE family protein n=1 Tax=Pseudolabrys sp. TaxID=1960880 RepID=UPI003D115878